MIGLAPAVVDGSETPVLARISGRLIKAKVWIALGDRVRAEICPYDRRRGRIMGRL